MTDLVTTVQRLHVGERANYTDTQPPRRLRVVVERTPTEYAFYWALVDIQSAKFLRGGSERFAQFSRIPVGAMLQPLNYFTDTSI